MEKYNRLEKTLNDNKFTEQYPTLRLVDRKYHHFFFVGGKDEEWGYTFNFPKDFNSDPVTEVIISLDILDPTRRRGATLEGLLLVRGTTDKLIAKVKELAKEGYELQPPKPDNYSIVLYYQVPTKSNQQLLRLIKKFIVDS